MNGWMDGTMQGGEKKRDGYGYGIRKPVSTKKKEEKTKKLSNPPIRPYREKKF
jgi:hypothetical protein